MSCSTMMRWSGRLLVCLLLLGPALPLHAQSSETTGARIGIVDVQRVLRDAKSARGVRPQMDAVRRAFQEEVREQERQLREEAQKLINEQVVLSEEAFSLKRRELDEKGRQAEVALKERRRRLDTAFNRTRDRILQEMVKVARVVAKTSNVDVVLERRVVFLPAKAIDLTDEIIKALDESLPVIELVLDEGSSDNPDTRKKN